MFLVRPTETNCNQHVSRPWGRPKTHWSDSDTRLVWEQLWILPEELEEVSRGRGKSGWMDGCQYGNKILNFESLNFDWDVGGKDNIIRIVCRLYVVARVFVLTHFWY